MRPKAHLLLTCVVLATICATTGRSNDGIKSPPKEAGKTSNVIVTLRDDEESVILQTLNPYMDRRVYHVTLTPKWQDSTDKVPRPTDVAYYINIYLPNGLYYSEAIGADELAKFLSDDSSLHVRLYDHKMCTCWGIMAKGTIRIAVSRGEPAETLTSTSLISSAAPLQWPQPDRVRQVR